jgi:acyl-CoA thioesterase
MDADLLAQRCVEQMLEDDAVSKAMGMDIDSIKAGEAVVSMTVQKDMLNGHNSCHGGVIFSLADSAFAFACNSFNEMAVAASCSIDYLRPVLLGQRPHGGCR